MHEPKNRKSSKGTKTQATQAQRSRKRAQEIELEEGEAQKRSPFIHSLSQ